MVLQTLQNPLVQLLFDRVRQEDSGLWCGTVLLELPDIRATYNFTDCDDWSTDWRPTTLLTVTTGPRTPTSRRGHLCLGKHIIMGRTKEKNLDSTGASGSENYVTATPANPLTDKLDVILKEIQESRLTIEQRLGSITTELAIFKDDHQKLVDRVKQTETLPPSCLDKKTVNVRSSNYKSRW
ncbi:hypothetical protein NDU88_005191 [Pleurodeles waltl]|uniref:Uncharacterized protein n=1 Tax=Pleurodeles waltl TaxID=8319 RepID=A0AAV7UJ88_PLEWA|nr:hypothetical protein NDU88_005191 [Pleurodeles waltl]